MNWNDEFVTIDGLPYSHREQKKLRPHQNKTLQHTCEMNEQIKATYLVNIDAKIARSFKAKYWMKDFPTLEYGNECAE